MRRNRGINFFRAGIVCDDHVGRADDNPTAMRLANDAVYLIVNPRVQYAPTAISIPMTAQKTC
jgi:hypothetical protein